MEKSSIKEDSAYYSRGIISVININLVLIVSTLAVLSTSKLLTLFVNSTCVYKKHFGVICPFCGGTRATLNILRLNLVEAFKYHPTTVLLFFCIIAFDLLGIFNLLTHRDNKNLAKVFYVILFSYIFLTIIQYAIRLFYIYNNLPCDFMYLNL